MPIGGDQPGPTKDDGAGQQNSGMIDFNAGSAPEQANKMDQPAEDPLAIAEDNKAGHQQARPQNGETAAAILPVGFEAERPYGQGSARSNAHDFGNGDQFQNHPNQRMSPRAGEEVTAMASRNAVASKT